ncbi:acetylornithine aminotransferase [Cerrena zonata]|uniref:Acetylornithine aminotransferase n=1 Tax=Cerrena zonata TaxID=2478898 RepID=A0AAW0FU11_9APHY
MIRSISAKCLRTRLVGSKQCFSTTTRVFNSSTGIPDATEESHTGQYINTITKPYTATTYARPNVVITHGKGSHLYDLENRQYIDFTAGIAVTCLGHSDPEITNIISEQAKTLIHCSNLYYNLPAGELLSKLVHKTLQAGGMKDAQRVFLCNSGTEANEAALKFARKHGVQVADINDIKSVETLMKKDKTCAVIIEPIQGEGGVTPVDAEFLVALRKLCDENDVVLIYDEIQCGLGRTGKLWAHCDLPQEAHPDILTMAKALGNGFPIGATMISEKIEKSLNVGDHGTTYGGNPLGAKIGSYVVDKISKPEFLESVNQKAEKFNKKLTAIAENYPNIITSVKGKGLLMGIQFKENVDIASIVSQCRQHGLLVITAGMNVIRLVPALNIPDDVIQDGLNILTKCLDDSLAKYKIEDPLTKN